MKSLFLFALLLLLAPVDWAQTYTYKPLALDTSCFWKSDYFFYDSGFTCQGERISAVTKDTIIAGNHFFTVETYTTVAPNPPIPFCNAIYLAGISYEAIREDTVAKKVYYADGSVAIDFNLNIGDTLVGSSPIAPWVVDSINIQQIMGVDRKVQWTAGNFPAQTIEGIGMNYNFPARNFGEWGIPVYRLQCFSRGGVVLYSRNGSGNCIRSPKLGVARIPDLTRQAFSVDGNRIRILDAQALPLTMQFFDLSGKLLFTKVIDAKTTIEADVAPGNYLMRLTNKKSTGSFVVPIGR